MTPKLLARLENTHSRHLSYFSRLIAENGDVFAPVYYHDPNLRVGDTVWIGKRLNIPSNGWCYEVYQVTLEQSPIGRAGIPKTWFGTDRRVLEKL